MEDERQPLLAGRPKARWYHFAGDMFNTLKAFIGTNYLALAFAFKQSGLVFGIVGVFLIAVLTDHCCRLMVRTKYFVIDILMEEEQSKRAHTAREMEEYRAKLENTLGYGDLGRIALGKWCAYLIDFAVWFTQFLTIVAYFIFLANTIYTLFPLRIATIPLNHSIPVLAGGPVSSDVHLCPIGGSGGEYYDPRTQVGVPMLNIPNLRTDHDDCEYPAMKSRSHRRSRRSTIPASHGAVSNDISSLPNLQPSGHYRTAEREDSQTSTTEPIRETTTVPANNTTTASNTTTVPANTTTTAPTTTNIGAPNITTPPNITTTTPMPTPFFYLKSIAPDMKLLFFIPLPFFLCTSLIRELRILSPLTVIATGALFAGAFSVMGFEISGFIVADGISLYKWGTLPVFLGQLISAYEGIGCILPIEASMEGNRWAFPHMLRSSVYIVFLILTAFGSVGYLRYGEDVKQLITLSIKQHTPLAIAIDITLIISVLFTYPLQCFPVLTITEKYLIAPGALFGPRLANPVKEDDERRVEEPHDRNIQDHDSRGLLDSTSTDVSDHSDVAIVVPQKIPAWKRNVVRVLITFCAMGTAIALWDAYAYVGAVSGAVGCSLLAYILPCLIHLKIKGRIMRVRLIIKDLLIIFLSAVASVLTLVVIIGEIANGKIK